MQPNTKAKDKPDSLRMGPMKPRELCGHNGKYTALRSGIDPGETDRGGSGNFVRDLASRIDLGGGCGSFPDELEFARGST